MTLEELQELFERNQKNLGEEEFNEFVDYFWTRFSRGGGGFDEAKRCIECQEWFTDDELIYGYCKECLEEEMTYENAIKYGSENEESVSINGFLASCFSADEIQEILLKELTQAKELMPSRIDEYVKTYCKDDLDYFAEWLEVQDVL